jgi:hypothetical protein
MNFMAGSSSSLGLASHFNPKRGGTKAQQTVIWAMKLAELFPYLLDFTHCCNLCHGGPSCG